MAMIFTRAIERDPTGFYDGSVLTRTFCQWYGDEARVASCDHDILEQMDILMEDAQGAEIFNDAVMHDGDGARFMRVRVCFGGRAMRRPAREVVTHGKPDPGRIW